MEDDGFVERTLTRIRPKKQKALNEGLEDYSRRRPTLPHSYLCSTIGAEGLNCRVRNGNGCFPLAKTTGKLYKLKNLSEY